MAIYLRPVASGCQGRASRQAPKRASVTPIRCRATLPRIVGDGLASVLRRRAARRSHCASPMQRSVARHATPTPGDATGPRCERHALSRACRADVRPRERCDEGRVTLSPRCDCVVARTRRGCGRAATCCRKARFPSSHAKGALSHGVVQCATHGGRSVANGRRAAARPEETSRGRRGGTRRAGFDRAIGRRSRSCTRRGDARRGTFAAAGQSPGRREPGQRPVRGAERNARGAEVAPPTVILF